MAERWAECIRVQARYAIGKRHNPEHAYPVNAHKR